MSENDKGNWWIQLCDKGGALRFSWLIAMCCTALIGAIVAGEAGTGDSPAMLFFFVLIIGVVLSPITGFIVYLILECMFNKAPTSADWDEIDRLEAIEEAGERRQLNIKLRAVYAREFSQYSEMTNLALLRQIREVLPTYDAAEMAQHYAFRSEMDHALTWNPFDWEDKREAHKRKAEQYKRVLTEANQLVYNVVVIYCVLVDLLKQRVETYPDDACISEVKVALAECGTRRCGTVAPIKESAVYAEVCRALYEGEGKVEPVPIVQT